MKNEEVKNNNSHNKLLIMLIALLAAAFVLIFVQGCGINTIVKELNGEPIVDSSKPIMAQMDEWYRGETPKESINKIVFAEANYSDAHPELINSDAFIEEFYADENNIGSIRCYIVKESDESLTLIISGNGYDGVDTVYANENSGGMFGKFIEVTDISGFEKLDTSDVSNKERIFYDYSKNIVEQKRSSKPIFDFLKPIMNDGGGWYRGKTPKDNINKILFAEANYSDAHPELKQSDAFIEEFYADEYNTGSIRCYVVKESDGGLTLIISGNGYNGLDTVYANDNSGGMFGEFNKVTEINGLEKLDTSNAMNMSYMFYECSALTSLDLSSFDATNVTDMDSMFFECSSLKSLKLSSFNTGNVTDMGWMFHGCFSLTSLDVSSFNTANVTDMRRMFYECSSLASLDLSNFNTTKVTDMGYMFFCCRGLASLDLSSYNTTKVTDMGYMFFGCRGLTSLDLSSFTTDNVLNMSTIFYGCDNLTSLDLSNFNTTKVTDMGYMFFGCRGLISLDLSSFNTANVIDMGCMFSECSSLTSLDLSSFNTKDVTNMYNMFSRCSSLTTLDLSGNNKADVLNMFGSCSGLTSFGQSGFNTANVMNMSYMFSECSLLQTIYATENFTTESVSKSDSMFSLCGALKGGEGTRYSTDNADDKTYARIDKGEKAPGYFTLKS